MHPPTSLHVQVNTQERRCPGEPCEEELCGSAAEVGMLWGQVRRISSVEQLSWACSSTGPASEALCSRCVLMLVVTASQNLLSVERLMGMIVSYWHVRASHSAVPSAAGSVPPPQ